MISFSIHRLVLLIFALSIYRSSGQPLTEAEFNEALPLLQAHFTEQSSLKDKTLSPETLTSLLPSLGVTLSAGAFRSPSVDPIKTELLPTQVTYWHLCTYQAPKVADLDSMLELSLLGKSKGLIIDLRDTQAPNDFEGAARVAGDLVPLSTVLFTVQGLQTPQAVFQVTQQKMLYHHPIVVLINRATLGSGEALAAALRRSAKAIVIGRSTLGQGALFVESKLSSGRYLRMPAGLATLPDGTKLYGQPLQPDIPVFVEDQQENEALAQIRLGPAVQGLIQSGHKRLSEAALVNDENPELDDMFTQNDKKKESKTVQDPVLLRALDTIDAINAIYPPSTP